MRTRRTTLAIAATMVLGGGVLAMRGLGSPGAAAGEKTIQVTLCDNETRTTVPAGGAKTRAEGQEIADALMSQWRQTNPDRDWILTRILWLSGKEIGKNRLGSVDTMRRYIYIHGAPDSEPMGSPRSIGCIRMANGDLAELFDLVPAGTVVDIA